MKKETNPLQILLIVVLCVIGAIVALKLLSFAFAVLTYASIMMWVFMPILVVIAIVLLVLNLLKKK